MRTESNKIGVSKSKDLPFNFFSFTQEMSELEHFAVVFSFPCKVRKLILLSLDFICRSQNSPLLEDICYNLSSFLLLPPPSPTRVKAPPFTAPCAVFS